MPPTMIRIATVFFLSTLLHGPALAQEGPVRVQVEGLRRDVRSNVLAVLSIATAARERSVSADRVRRLHARAPGEIALALEPFGFYRPTVIPELRQDRRGWIAHYRIDPGPGLSIRRIDLAVHGPGADEPRVRRALAAFPLREGSVLQHGAYESGKLALVTAAAEQGYLDAAYDTSEIRIDLEAYHADVVLHLRTGPRFQFGAVSFRQDAVDPALLENYVTFRRGEPFDMTPLMDLQTALSGGPYFSRVEVLPRRDQAEGLEVPIDVEFVPRKTQRYEVGAGYGTNTGPRATVGVEFRRLNRRGHRAEGELTASFLERSVAARWVIPSAHPRTEVLSFFVGYADLDPSTSESETLRAGASLGRSRARWREVFSLSFEREIFVVGPDTGTSNLLVAGGSWSRTKSNDRIFPTQGARGRFEIRGSARHVLSRTSFLQLRANGKLIRSLARRTRLIVRADLGATFTSSFRDLPPTVRFFAGGDQSVRGYGYLSLGPIDDAGNVIGGEALLVGSIEVEQRFLERWGIAAFYDAGNAIDFLSGSLKQGVGGGARWLSPIGLVRIDAALALSKSGSPLRIHLTIGPDF